MNSLYPDWIQSLFPYSSFFLFSSLSFSFFPPSVVLPSNPLPSHLYLFYVYVCASRVLSVLKLKESDLDFYFCLLFLFWSPTPSVLQEKKLKDFLFCCFFFYLFPMIILPLKNKNNKTNKQTKTTLRSSFTFQVKFLPRILWL